MSSNIADWDTLEELRIKSSGNYDSILEYENGTKYLKLRTISKGKRIKKFAKEKNITNYSKLKVDALLKLAFQNSTEAEIEKFINKTFTDERKIGKGEEKKLYSELSKVKNVDWGGVRQNMLEKTLVDHYVKKIKNYDEINAEITTKIIKTVSDWTISNWYSFWANTIIENSIKDHTKVLPGIGDIKYIDFFWENIPFDLKTTKFAQGFIDYKRKEGKLLKEYQIIKKFAKENQILFNKKNGDEKIKQEIIKIISESTNLNWKKFVKENIYDERKKILEDAVKNPEEYAIWNYENQGEGRFGDENRFFLILVNKQTTEESWKLKRESKFIKEKINEFLDGGPERYIMRNLDFSYKGKKFKANCCILFIIEE
ncbi:MAG: hypothetical protein EXS76_04315 [Nitrosarchaeum sp.]|nr:hypothetical protein [Nitrosarchaeum sp.]